MLFSKSALCSALLLGAAGWANAAPTLVKRTERDVATLQYALVLENLEAKFYADGAAKFTEKDFADAGLDHRVFSAFGEINAHEATHVKVLSSVLVSLGQTPLPACEYTFPYTDVKGYTAIARILENVGVSAYTGAIADIDTDAIKYAAASIATVEARHASFLNYINHRLPVPNAFDSPLNPNSVVSLAGSFIKSCPFTFPIKPLPALAISPAMGQQGQTTDVTLTAEGLKEGDWCLSYNGADNFKSPIMNVDAKWMCPISSMAKGDVILFVVKAGIAANFTVFGNEDMVVAGPTLFQVIP